VPEKPNAEEPRNGSAREATPEERRLLSDLFDAIDEYPERVDAAVACERVEQAFAYACSHHADDRGGSSGAFIIDPVGVAKICAEMRLDTKTLCAALLRDTVDDTSASLEEIAARFGGEVAGLVDGVTKLDSLSFQWHGEAQAENFRKMMLTMATDIRVILIKLAGCLQNMRTISAMSRQKQIENARESLHVCAPIAHQLGFRAIDWELEDLAFQTLHPRKYNEIKALVAQPRAERERYVNQAGQYLAHALDEIGIEAVISGRVKHFYSIYSKMTTKGLEFNEIYDLTAIRVIVGSVKDCYGAVGVIHSLWAPLRGRFRDFIAMPKFNMYQSLHTTVIGPDGRPLEIQIRTRDMHDHAESGIAAIRYSQAERAHILRLAQLRPDLIHATLPVAEQHDSPDAKAFADTLLQSHSVDEDVFVFTPRGEVKPLAVGGTALDLAYKIHTELGHRCVGAKVNGELVTLSHPLRSGDVVEILATDDGKGPTREWLAFAQTIHARRCIKRWLNAQDRAAFEEQGRTALLTSLRRHGEPATRPAWQQLVAVLDDLGFRDVRTLLVAIGRAKVSADSVATKLRRKATEVHETAATDSTDPPR
jgi:GTP diphosphokinase / guanosine-3',5'-bis(diphosphate) 3'-diphosphatase